MHVPVPSYKRRLYDTTEALCRPLDDQPSLCSGNPGTWRPEMDVRSGPGAAGTYEAGFPLARAL